MIEAVMIWNEPNNKSHWDFQIDPEWKIFSEMAIAAAEAVAGVKQGGKVRIDGVYGAEIAVEELAGHFAKPGLVLRESGGEDAVAASLESLRQKADLSLFAAAVDAFDGDELAQGCGIRAGMQGDLDPIPKRMHRGERRLHLV